MMTELKCRFCGTPLEHIFIDLGMTPPSNSYLPADKLLAMEPFYPLRVFVCRECFLVQLPAYHTSEDIFSDYAYFSSYSDSWLDHCRKFADDATEKFELDDSSQVIEVASNDGYLLQYFKPHGVPVLGIEPAANVAAAAIDAGIDTIVAFFGTQLAAELSAKNIQADLLVGNNVFAHVPDLNDFVAGFKIILAPNGIISLEFPHLMKLMEENQFDTIYHEHFSYFSLMTAQKVFQAHALKIYDVEELPTHGGSLRILAGHMDNHRLQPTSRLAALVEKETRYGLGTLDGYTAFADKVHATKRQLLSFLISCHEAGKTVAGYGAPAKGNTLLNYCGIREDLLPYTVDRSPHKQGQFLPGTHIPVYAVEEIEKRQPDYLLILPWNLKDEIMAQMAGIGRWGGRFVVPIPHVQVFDAVKEQ
ncbi:SAM-dependent methyltransferase [Desulfosarcina ovata subsp. sediminis]|uniref:SAM-dependent methyltransferase n=1 Tax=Desulfosarcina ovata subsp. sediminis TaxID=885957 RepID=A0A5K7ZKM3_9BACT|nr:class I SAM-dependent methyltransferase [Desulfosarcina ovata]BBO82788.1 SAM-dependent methyltransferase [Desulfosarcina ovata subsp. sediminis]